MLELDVPFSYPLANGLVKHDGVSPAIDNDRESQSRFESEC